MQGAGGRDLEAFWTENRFQAYRGVSVLGFPNFFAILGPYGYNGYNGYNGSSYFDLIETQSAHIVRLLKAARKRGASRIGYFASVLGRRDKQVFFQGQCSTANSYYFDEHGDVPLRPASTLETMWDAAHFPLDDYAFTTPVGSA
ncbi:hypothetical protein GCM10028801_39060 [Nocardioides maradonensis]